MNRISFVLVLIATSFALADKPFDPITGRDTRAYPPDAEVTFMHIALDIQMPDPMSRSFTCDETIAFAAPAHAIDHVDLDAVALKIDTVTDLSGKPVPFRYDDKVLTASYSPPLAPGTQGGLKIHYACNKPKEGMYFALPDEYHRDRPLTIHTQGETETNRYWFICHDSPNTKQTTEITVTIPAKYKALSNGALVSRDHLENKMVRYHYALSHPHAAYLVSLVIGDFSVVSDQWRDKPVEYWVPSGQEGNAKRTFGRTPEMMELFSKLTHYDYPWEKYAQSVVFEFGAGGMENTSCTTLIETASLDERAAIDSDLEGLISHELAHQWFGDTITCKSWPHTWLNEGFATFMDAVWHEHAHGPESYAHQIWGTMQGVAESDDPAARDGIVWFHYDSPEDIFGRGVSNPYGKGSCVIHMLRRSLGDELFWNCMGTYLKRYEFKPVETDDLRKVVDELSGRSYERFFEQWLYRAGTPKFKVSYDWDRDAQSAIITLEQTQPISAEWPAFDVLVPISFVDEDSGKPMLVNQSIAMHGRTTKLNGLLPREPKQVIIDPDGTLLAKWDLSGIPLPMLVAQAQGGPSPFARYNAIAALGSQDRDEARDVLKSILIDEKQHETFRQEAAAALGHMHSDEARDILLDALATGRAITDHHVRRSAIEALGKYRSKEVADTLLRFAKHDETYSVEAAATEGLANQESTDEIVNTLIDNAKKSSFRDQIRTAAINALADFGDARGMSAAVALADPGQPLRVRGAGINAIGKIGREMKDRSDARRMLLGMVDEPRGRVADAAIRALGDLGDEKAIKPLETIVKSGGEKDRRDAARAAIDAIHKHEPVESASLRSLRERVETLERARSNPEESPTKVRRGETKEMAPASAPSTNPG